MNSIRVHSTAKKTPKQQTPIEQEIMIRDKSAEEIVAILAENHAVEELYISCKNQITSSVISAIFQLKNVTNLNLYGNQIGAAEACEIGKHLVGSNLRILDLACNYIGDPGTRKIANNMENLTKLYLEHNKISDAGAGEIGMNLKDSNVTDLRLSINQIGDAGVTEIANHLVLSNLTILELNHNQISDKGAREIGMNLVGSNLTTLHMYDNQIGDAGACEIAKNMVGSKLRSLKLSGNQIGDTGACEITRNLKGSNLTDLNLYENKNIHEEVKRQLIDEWDKLGNNPKKLQLYDILQC